MFGLKCTRQCEPEAGDLLHAEKVGSGEGFVNAILVASTRNRREQRGEFQI
jgi:hypothetical protein